MATWDKSRWRSRVGGPSVTFPRGTPKKVVDDYEAKVRLGLIDRSLVRERVALKDYSERFLAVYPTIKKRSEATLIRDRFTLDGHILPRFGSWQLKAVTAPDVLEWQQTLRAKGLKPQTINNAVSTLSAIFRLAVLERKVDYNPCASVPRATKVDRPHTFWRPDEADRFLCHARDRDWQVFQVAVTALNTGMRPGELAGLKRDCLFFEQGYVEVRRNWCSKTRRVNEHTKTGTVRRIAVPREVLSLLADKAGLPMDALVFPGINNDFGTRRLQPLAREAGVRPIRFHDLRHTFASWLVMHGKHPVEIKELLGHRKLSSTDVYMHLADDLKRGVTDCLTQGMSYLGLTGGKVAILRPSRV